MVWLWPNSTPCVIGQYAYVYGYTLYKHISLGLHTLHITMHNTHVYIGTASIIRYWFCLSWYGYSDLVH